MDYKLLGMNDLRITEQALGTMTFSNVWGWVPQ
jgi:hypothetical protein